MWLTLVVTFVVIGLVLFFAAGAIDYWQLWIFLGVVVISSVLLTRTIVKNPVLLTNRTKAGEQRSIQKIIVLCTGLPAIAAFIFPPLDRRFAWSDVPPWLSILGDCLVLIGMWMVFRVFKENSFGSTTVEVSNNQKVISTGPYAIVRHPMYSCAAVFFVGMSFALGSYWGLIPSVLTTLGLVWRLLDEEKLLVQNLPGYAEYRAKVRWRLIPGIF